MLWVRRFRSANALLLTLIMLGFVVAYSIQAIAWLFVYCTPYSGWWEFQWMNPFDPRCHDFNLFINLVYWNVGMLLSLQSGQPDQSVKLTLSNTSMQHIHRRLSWVAPCSHHLEPQDEATNPTLCHRHPQPRILVRFSPLTSWSVCDADCS